MSPVVVLCELLNLLLLLLQLQNPLECGRIVAGIRNPLPCRRLIVKHGLLRTQLLQLRYQ
jgi:hypothetical protein